MLMMARAIERAGDRATNIAEMVGYLVGGMLVVEERPKGGHDEDPVKSYHGSGSMSLPTWRSRCRCRAGPRLSPFRGDFSSSIVSTRWAI
jgi:hypothetical protein